MFWDIQSKESKVKIIKYELMKSTNLFYHALVIKRWRDWLRNWAGEFSRFLGTSSGVNWGSPVRWGNISVLCMSPRLPIRVCNLPVFDKVLYVSQVSPWKLYQKRHQHRYFPVKFAKISRTSPVAACKTSFKKCFFI